MALWPSWPPLVRSAGPLPHSRRTWCILGDPARSGQPRRRSKSHATVGQELHEAHRRAGRDLHRTGLGSPVGWPVRPPEPTGQLKHAFPRMRPANRRTPRPVDRPSRGVRASDANGPGSSSRGRLRRVALEKRCRPSSVTSRLALGEALLGLQQPVHHQQLAQQVIQGLHRTAELAGASRPAGHLHLGASGQAVSCAHTSAMSTK
jgi:hypothetical protein